MAMFQMFTQFIKKMEGKTDASDQALEAIADKVGCDFDGNISGNGGTKSSAKGRHAEKLERDVDYATSMGKSWNLYTISDNLENFSQKNCLATSK